MHRTMTSLAVFSFFLTAALPVVAQNPAGFRGGFGGGFPIPLPSDILRVQPPQEDLAESTAEQTAPKVHLLLGRRHQTRQFVLRSFAAYEDRNRLRRVYALPQGGRIRRTARHHRRQH